MLRELGPSQLLRFTHFSSHYQCIQKKVFPNEIIIIISKNKLLHCNTPYVDCDILTRPCSRIIWCRCTTELEIPVRLCTFAQFIRDGPLIILGWVSGRDFDFTFFFFSYLPLTFSLSVLILAIFPPRQGSFQFVSTFARPIPRIINCSPLNMQGKGSDRIGRIGIFNYLIWYIQIVF